MSEIPPWTKDDPPFLNRAQASANNRRIKMFFGEALEEMGLTDEQIVEVMKKVDGRQWNDIMEYKLTGIPPFFGWNRE